MAEGAWIPVYDSIWTSKKTSRVASELRTSNDVIGAKVLRLCAWARDHTSTGDLAGIAPEVIAKAIGLEAPTDHKAERVAKGAKFLKALADADFLVGDKLHIKGWEDGPGKLAATRARDRDRQAEKRERERVEREAKARERAIADDRQRRIDEARAFSFSTSSEGAKQEAVAPDERGSSADVTRMSRGSHAEPVRNVTSALPQASLTDTPNTAETQAPVRVTSEGQEAMSRGREKEERDNPLPLTGSGRGRGSDRGLARVSGKPDCGRGPCRHPWYVHRSQVKDTSAGYAGDCSPCAKVGTPCPGYTSEVLDPDIPDERSANA